MPLKNQLSLALLLGLILVTPVALTAPPDLSRFDQGIWIDRERFPSLPPYGSAWRGMLRYADAPTQAPDLSNQEDMTNVRVFAKALVYARTGTATYREQVLRACDAVIGTEGRSKSGDPDYGRTLALGRGLMAYVIAADLVGLPEDQDRRFRRWLETIVDKPMTDGRTLRSTHEDRPNNWGNHAGASRIAVAAYLRDADEIAAAATVFKGYLGDRSSYAGFEYGDLDWQANPNEPVGINPLGATKRGHSIDGVLPDDQRRAGGFDWPPPTTNYAYEGLQGALAQAVMLERAGYEPFEWEDRALLRAIDWLYEQADFPAVGDDVWQLFVFNQAYGTTFPTTTPTFPGKAIGFTDWTHMPLPEIGTSSTLRILRALGGPGR